MSSTELSSTIRPDTSTPIRLPITTLNSTEEDLVGTENILKDVDFTTISWAAVNGILFVIILGGNTLTIIAVRTCRRLRSVISNLFILSLAVSDFMVGLALPYHVAFYLGWNLGHSHGLCLLRFFLMIFACCVSLATLITIAVDRYIAIVYPFHYRRCMTRRVAYLIIVSCWFGGVAIAAIPMFWNHWKTAINCEFDEILPPGYVIGVITPAFALIWTFMLLLYWRIMREASKQARQLASCGSSDWKSIQIVVLIMGSFTICWLPYFIVVCTKTFNVYDQTTWLYKYALSLATCNSGLNPIIYAWKNSNFRRAFVRILCCQSPNCNNQSLETSRLHSALKPSPTVLPITHNQPTVQNIIILPVCDQSTENRNCLQNAVQTISHQHITTATENNTCAICKCVIRNSLQLQQDLNKSLQNCNVIS